MLRPIVYRFGLFPLVALASILSTALLQNPSFFDADGEKTWVWNCNGELAPYDVDDDVFFLVKQLLRAVRLLRFQPLAQVCSVDFERVSSVSQIMNIHASMEFDGLGPRRCFPFCHLRQFAYHSVTLFFADKNVEICCILLFILTFAEGGGSRLMPESFFDAFR
jgi:hypothetical protein